MMARSSAVSKMGIGCLIFLALAAGVATPSGATLIRGGSGNTAAPGDDPGWANVGLLSGSSMVASGVYVGGGWVMTAAHVWNGGVTSANFGGSSYGFEAGTWHQLHKPGEPGTGADVGLVRLDGMPSGLADLTVSELSPPDLAEVVGIGYGSDYDPTETWWNSDWEKEVGTPAYRGFELSGGRTKRWGKNHIDAVAEEDKDVTIGGYTTHALHMTFDQSGGAGDDEMQVVPGDSGGGLFYKNGSDWELTGIIVAMGTYGGNPGQPSDTAVYGNKSYAADLSEYHDQIMVIIPEPSTLVLLLSLGTGCLVWSVWRRVSRPSSR